MNLIVSGVHDEVEKDISVTNLIIYKKIESPEYVSVSVNDEFVLREHFDDTILKEGDIVEFLYFMGGGSSC